MSKCTWCGNPVEPTDGFRLGEHAGDRGAVFCRLEHVVPWAMQGAHWEAGEPLEPAGTDSTTSAPTAAPSSARRHCCWSATAASTGSRTASARSTTCSSGRKREDGGSRPSLHRRSARPYCRGGEGGAEGWSSFSPSGHRGSCCVDPFCSRAAERERPGRRRPQGQRQLEWSLPRSPVTAGFSPSSPCRRT